MSDLPARITRRRDVALSLLLMGSTAACGSAAHFSAVPKNESAACRDGVLPDFPLPAPTPSARMALPERLLAEARAQPSPRLRDVATVLDALMMSAGYSQRAYFRLHDEGQTLGFALVTRMERIHDDGRPFPPEERFVPAGAPDQFDVLSFLQSLFVAPVGFYRVIVLIVARAPVEVDGPAMTEAGAERLLTEGSSRLLGCVAALPLTGEYAADALVYEFRHAPEDEAASADSDVTQLKPGKLDPGLHLRRAGILDP